MDLEEQLRQAREEDEAREQGAARSNRKAMAQASKGIALVYGVGLLIALGVPAYYLLRGHVSLSYLCGIVVIALPFVLFRALVRKGVSTIGKKW